VKILPAWNSKKLKGAVFAVKVAVCGSKRAFMEGRALRPLILKLQFYVPVIISSVAGCFFLLVLRSNAAGDGARTVG
jgi:hypothetical protein